MLGNKPWSEWVHDYERSHLHPLNRRCHAVGIPMIALSLPLFLMAPWLRASLWPAVALFLTGWMLQFAGHIAERKRPEFFSDWRYLFVGLRWWLTLFGRRD